MKSFLVASILLAAVVVMQQTEAYIPEQLQPGINNQSAHATSLLKIGTLVLDACANQISNGDYRNIDACLHFTEIFNKHITITIGETEGDIQSITGLGFGLK